jgi:uncharacterized protein (TIGR02246 family)
MTHTSLAPTIVSAITALALGCTPTTTETPPGRLDLPAPDAPPPDPAELMEADRLFAEETARAGVEGWVAAFAEDGVMLIPGGEVRGRDSIRSFMTPVFANPDLRFTWEPQFADVGSGGDLGYTVGRYLRQVVSPEGDTVRAEGQYTTVWKRGEDGVWRVVLDLGVPDPDG